MSECSISIKHYLFSRNILFTEAHPFHYLGFYPSALSGRLILGSYPPLGASLLSSFSPLFLSSFLYLAFYKYRCSSYSVSACIVKPYITLNKGSILKKYELNVRSRLVFI